MTPQDLVTEHKTIKAAADAAGVKYHTFYAWLRANKFPAKHEAKFAAAPTGSHTPSQEGVAGVAATE